MKTPGWPVLVIALLLGLVTGDSVVTAQAHHPKRQEVTNLAPPLFPFSWHGGQQGDGK